MQIKYNKMHTIILHSPHAQLFTIHLFIRSFIHSFIHITHHTTNASPMHHQFITPSQCIIPYNTHSSHCISIIPSKHYIQQITLTHNALDASQRWCIITIMHHSDDASQQCITTLMYYSTTSLQNHKELIVSQDLNIFNPNNIDLSINVKIWRLFQYLTQRTSACCRGP